MSQSSLSKIKLGRLLKSRLRRRQLLSICPTMPLNALGRLTAAIEACRGSTFNQEAFEGFAVVDHDAMELAVETLAANRIVACFHGRSEMGPRALGNRSILMSPLVAENKDILNRDVKHR